VVVVQRFDKPNKPLEVYPNISIVSYSDSTILSKEGCLSVPNQRHSVERAAKIKIQYFSIEKEQNVSEEIEGF
ncbi:MAG: peptide deformylase, partial [Bacteroidia bacterium]|nr:peptide deformylase [Bacteroidia bacterium]